MKRYLSIVLGFVLSVSVSTAQEAKRGGGDERGAPPPPKEHLLPTETFLSKSRQVTFVGERSGEAYYSPDASMVAYQSVRGDCPHYQIFIEKLDGTALWRVTPGKGLTTCVHWRPDSKKVLWASTHLDPATYGPPPATGGRYVWDKHPSFDIFVSNPDGSEPVRLTSTPGYDAEGSWSNDGSRIVYTSSRDGDLEIYTMAADGSDVRRITNSKGYDGGPFFSPDDKRICFRGFRNPKNERFAHLYVVDADGKNEKQISFDDAVNWAPYWHPNGRTLIYSKGLGGHRNFELYLCDVETATHVRLTRHPGADVLPVFSPDGKQVMWTSTRADGRSQIFVADFRMPTDEEWKALSAEESRREAADRLLGDAKALSDDAMEGRRSGTAGAEKAAEYVENALKEAGLTPAGANGWRQGFPIVTGAEAVGATLALKGMKTLGLGDTLAPAAFSGDSKGTATKASSDRLAVRGYGLAIPGVADDYAGLPSVEGAIVVLFEKGLPEGLDEAAKSNPHADVASWRSGYARATAAKLKGAAGVVFVADSEDPKGDVVAAPKYEGSTARLGIPVVRASRAWVEDYVKAASKSLLKAEDLSTAAQGVGFDIAGDVAVSAESRFVSKETHNVIGAVKGTSKPDEWVVISAHYDHLGFGGSGSLSASAAPEIHNGADDNASGTAGLIEVARRLAKAPPARSVLVIGWSGEEEGLLGSAHWAEQPTLELAKIVGNVNLDMIGRLGKDGVAIDGVASGKGLDALVAAANTEGLKVATTAGTFSGRSDHATFLMKGIPAIHLFTGAHVDYHKPSDDWERLNADGMAQVVNYTERLVRAFADLPERMEFVKPQPKASTSMGGGFGAWLGTIPSYSQDEGGVLLSGVSAGSPAEKAGMKADDVLIRMGDVKIENVEDFTLALRARKPGDKVAVEVLRGGKSMVFDITLGRR